MKVHHWDNSADGALSEQALWEKLAKLGYRATRYVYPVGTCFPTHSHAVDKMDAVLSGTFRITMGSNSVVLRGGDAVHVPRGAEHSAEVVGEEPVVSLDGVKE